MAFANKAIIGSLLSSRGTLKTAHVGSLPLTTFVYILTGALVFLICLFPLVTFITTFRKRAPYHAVASNDEKDQTPNFRQPQSHSPAYLEAIARLAVEKHPLQPTIYVRPPIYNLPLPIGEAVVVQQDKGAALLSIEDLYDTQELLAEKKRLDMSIHNLKRVCGVAGQEASSMGAMKRLNDASRKREQLVASIDESFKKLKDQKASWTDEEWSLIELIMQAYGRRI
jgi:hypothetical protein